MKPIVIAHHCPIYAEGLRHVVSTLNHVPPVVAPTVTILRREARRKPDCALIAAADFVGPKSWQFFSDLKAEYPEIGLLLVGNLEKTEWDLQELIRLQAGFVPDIGELDTILQAVGTVADGRPWICNKALPTLTQRAGRKGKHGTFTPRERLVLMEMGRCTDTREVAESLGIGTETVRTYQKSLKRKLGFKIERELWRYAIEMECGRHGVR